MPLGLDIFHPENFVDSVLHGETPPQRYSFNGLRVRRFSPATADVETYGQGLWSPQYNATGLAVAWAWTAVGTGVAVWGLSLGRYEYGVGPTLDSAPDDVFGDETVVTTTIGANYMPIQATMAILHADVPMLALEFYRVRVRHLGTHGSRTIAVPPMLLGLAIGNFDDD